MTWTQERSEAVEPAGEPSVGGTRPRRGTLRVYLGAAPGVGKTYDALNEARRAKERRRDVVVGFVETYGRPLTEAAIGDLEIVPRKKMTYRGATFEEMDIDAVLARRPERALVDELAHTNVPGSRNEKRWQDVAELLDAGIDVISTLNIQHLESINDVVERITGIRQRETIPDEVVRSAEQIELVDITPEALRRRLAHGNVYPPEKIDAALANYFRAGNLTALRELALLWVADQVDVGLEEYRRRHGITAPWETRERVVVGVTGAPDTEALIRRAARIARRSHGELLGVHVRADEGLTGPPTDRLERHRRLLEDVGGEFHEVAGTDVAAALVDFAHAENATQLVLGSSERSRWEEAVRGSVINRVVRLSGPVDVLVISHERSDETAPPASRRRRRRPVLSPVAPRRLIGGWLLTAVGGPLLTLVLVQLRDDVDLSTVLLAFMALVVLVGAVGGTVPAVVAAVAAFFTANWFFTPPLHRWTIASGDDVVALAVFLGVALVVSGYVDAAARRAIDAVRARDQARTLAGLAATMGEQDPLPDLLEHVRSVFGLDAAVVLRAVEDGWRIEAEAGAAVPVDPEAADNVEEIAPGVVLVLAGPSIRAEDQLVLNAFAAQLATVIEQGRLRDEAGHAQALADADALRSALLQAVCRDLRAPLTTIRTSADRLADPATGRSDEDRARLVHAISDETDRLTGLVSNLLDMSRIQAGVLSPSLRPVDLRDVVTAAVRTAAPVGATVDVDMPDTVPPVLADADLLRRALTNIVDNAIRYSPPGRPARVQAGAFTDRVDIRVIDQGPGIPSEDRERVFRPFERLGDDPIGIGVGLGLAVARGFLTAIAATVEIEDTPGGGTTILVTVPSAPE